MTEADLQVVRAAYARQMVALVGAAENRALEAAFAAVPRERFLPGESWTAFGPGFRKVAFPSRDPVYAYQDVLFALDADKGLNNGSPSLHARLIDALQPQPGETVLHLGAGTGYYSALLAEMVGPAGHVLAVELEPKLAAVARTALADRANVTVVEGDAAVPATATTHRIYVNFAVTEVPAAWVDALGPGGRIIFALGVPGRPDRPGGPIHSRDGAAFAITRLGSSFAAQMIGPAYFVHASGPLAMADPEAQERLAEAFRGGGGSFVRSFSHSVGCDPTRAWYCGRGWCLSYDAP